MKILKNCIKLSCSVKIYVPSTVNVDQAIDSKPYVEKALEFLSKEFGGSTSSEALGAWVSTQGQLIKERVTMVFSYATEDQLANSIDSLYDFCVSLKASLSQEAIALEVNNELYLI